MRGRLFFIGSQTPPSSDFRRDFLRDRPQLLRGRHVLRVGTRRGLVAVGEILAGDRRQRGVRRDIDLRRGALRHVFQEDRAERSHDPAQVRIVPNEIRPDHSRVHRVGRAPRTGEAPRELLGEQNVRELGLAVIAQRRVAFAPVEIVEFDAALRGPRVRIAAEDDHAAVRGQAIQKSVDEDEVTDVIREELELVAAHELQFRRSHHARVADDRIEIESSGGDARRARSHARGIGKLARERDRIPSSGRARLVRLLNSTRRADYARSAQGQHAQRLAPQPRVDAGHEHGLARERQSRRYILRSRSVAKTAGSLRLEMLNE